MAAELHHNVYVIELGEDVLSDKKFMKENHDYKFGTVPLYVGMTGLPPEKRFENHKSGYKASKFPKKYGVKLVPELYAKYNPMSYEDAKEMEVSLAEKLREKGHPVWQK